MPLALGQETLTALKPAPLLVAVEAEYAPIVLSEVLLTPMVISLASKIGAELAKRLDLAPPFLRVAFGSAIEPQPESASD